MSLSPEWDFVLSGVRAALRGREHEAIPDLAGVPTHWQRTAAIACQNRVGPLAYAGLRRFPQPPGAEPALDILKSAYVATAARNAVLFQALRVVLEALSAGRLPVIVLKGAALADIVYPERALRPMADIDLLIREEDLEEAESRLRGIGYDIAHDPQVKNELRTRHHHWVFHSTRPSSGGIPIELHWNLDPPGRPAIWDVGALFERAAPASISGVDALVLCPEDFLLHLCLHLCRHRFNGGVIALCDIAATISHHRERLDWSVFERRAAAAGASRYAYVPLRLAAELTGAAVPASVLSRLRESCGDDRKLDLARERILEEKGDLRGAAELLLRWRRRSSGGRAEAARRALSPGNAEARRRAASNPERPGSFYLAHLADLLRRYVPWLGALARHPRLVSRVAEREAGRTELDSWCAPGAAPRDPP